MITDSGVFFSASKLSSPDSFYKIELTYCLSTTLFTRDLALDVPSNNLIEKEYFRTQDLIKKTDPVNRTNLNILSNFTPHEIIACDGKDPPSFNNRIHCVKSVQIRIFLWSVFSPHSVRKRENTDQKKLRIWTLSVPCSDKNFN